MDDSPKDAAPRLPFDTVWGEMPGRAKVEAVSTLDTVAYEQEAPWGQLPANLPKVGHLAELGAQLGRGGNGEVLSAQQLGLDRLIAVKRPLAGTTELELSAALLREARVIGYLEHPNIPPVHFVGTSDNKALLVGLKRIEGEDLSARLDREKGLQTLDDHLEILLQICNAVGFAHNRGILHLDLKPGNVMTGPYGEVYVLDWGLAVAYREEVPANLPRPIVDGQVYGTPAFVAPETVTGQASTPATDVYQLGGILHCMLTGDPPNRGSTALEVLRAAYEPEPRTFGEEVPALLAEICCKALALEPTDRFANANALREALVSYRRDRRELEAAARAREQAAAMEEALSTAADDTSMIYQCYGRTRQAIDDAVGVKGSEESTQAVLQQVLESMIGWELERKNIGSATFLLTELPRGNPTLAARVLKQQERQESHMYELRALRDQINPEIGNSGKLFMVFVLGLTIALAELLPFLMGIETTARRVVIGYVVYLCFLVGISVIFRRQLLATRVNRGAALLVWILSLNGMLLRVCALQGLLGLDLVVVLDLALVTTVNVYAAIQLDKRLRYSVPCYALGTTASLLLPTIALPIYGVAHFVGLSVLGFAQLASRRDSRSVIDATT